MSADHFTKSVRDVFGQFASAMRVEDLRQRLGYADMLTALRMAETEIVETRRSITEARADIWGGTEHPRFEEVYQAEMARYDVLLERVRAGIVKATGAAR